MMLNIPFVSSQIPDKWRLSCVCDMENLLGENVFRAKKHGNPLSEKALKTIANI